MSPQELFIARIKCYLPRDPLLQKMGPTHPLKGVVEALFCHGFAVSAESWKDFPSITLTTNELDIDDFHGCGRIIFTSLPCQRNSDERQFHRLSDLVDRFNVECGADLKVHRGHIDYRQRTPHPETQAWYLTLCDRGEPWVAKIPPEYDDPIRREKFQERSRHELLAFGKWLMNILPTQ